MIQVDGKGKWRAFVKRAPFMDRLDFYMARECLDGYRVMQPDGSAFLVRNGEASPDGLKPTFFLGGHECRQMMAALAEALSEEGVRSPNDHNIRGRLEAQSAHLNDLRTILKLNNASGDK